MELTCDDNKNRLLIGHGDQFRVNEVYFIHKVLGVWFIWFRSPPSPNYLRVIKEDFMLGDYGPNAEGFRSLHKAVKHDFFRCSARDKRMDLFSHFQKFHQSQFLWWILDIYKKKRKPRVHENVANFRSTDHVYRINFLILWTINLFCLQGLESLRFRDGVGYVNAQFNCLLDHGSMPRIKVPPSRALSFKNFQCSPLYTYLLIGFMLCSIFLLARVLRSHWRAQRKPHGRLANTKKELLPRSISYSKLWFMYRFLIVLCTDPNRR